MRRNHSVVKGEQRAHVRRRQLLRHRAAAATTAAATTTTTAAATAAATTTTTATTTATATKGECERAQKRRLERRLGRVLTGREQRPERREGDGALVGAAACGQERGDPGDRGRPAGVHYLCEEGVGRTDCVRVGHRECGAACEGEDSAVRRLARRVTVALDRREERRGTRRHRRGRLCGELDDKGAAVGRARLVAESGELELEIQALLKGALGEARALQLH